MRTLIGATSLLLAVSPWILPSIAAAARLTQADARQAWRRALGRDRAGDHGNARTDGETRDPPTPHGCGEPKRAGERWPQ